MAKVYPPNPYQKICPGCNGTGVQKRDSDDLKIICPICQGTGKIQNPITKPVIVWD